MNNNPVKYTDPSGHKMVCDPETSNCNQEVRLETINNTLNTKQQSDDGNTTYKLNLGKNYEITGDDNNSDVVTTLQSVATGTQDIATIIDLAFAIPEVVIGTIGIVTVGPETIPITVGGMDILFNVFLGNAAETGFSAHSLILTRAADYLVDNQLGDSTLSSAITFGTGSLMLDPFGDLVIDSYASGYNHRIFNGFMDLLNGAPLFTSWP